MFRHPRHIMMSVVDVRQPGGAQQVQAAGRFEATQGMGPPQLVPRGFSHVVEVAAQALDQIDPGADDGAGAGVVAFAQRRSHLQGVVETALAGAVAGAFGAQAVGRERVRVGRDARVQARQQARRRPAHRCTPRPAARPAEPKEAPSGGRAWLIMWSGAAALRGTGQQCPRSLRAAAPAREPACSTEYRPHAPVPASRARTACRSSAA